MKLFSSDMHTSLLLDTVLNPKLDLFAVHVSLLSVMETAKITDMLCSVFCRAFNIAALINNRIIIFYYGNISHRLHCSWLIAVYE